MQIQIIETTTPPGKLADAEIHFTSGPLEGLKLIGFGIWERRGGSGRNVTFPARQYSVNGERRSFALLRPVSDSRAQDRIRDLILDAYAEQIEGAVQGNYAQANRDAIAAGFRAVERADQDAKAQQPAQEPEPPPTPKPPAFDF